MDKNFNKYFNYICPNLLKDVGTSTKRFKEYINKYATNQAEKVRSANGFKDEFFSLKK